MSTDINILNEINEFDLPFYDILTNGIFNISSNISNNICMYIEQIDDFYSFYNEIDNYYDDILEIKHIE